MGKASRTKQQPDRRSRIAAQREAERRREQRRRIYLAGGSIVVVAIIAIAFVIFKGNSSTATASSNGPTGTALASVVKTATSVPAADLDQVGAGSSAITPPFKLTPAQPALTSGGKPEMLYVGAEYCPYCAAERWSMVVALSRFGTFSGLATVHSSSTDVYPNTPTWTFAKATYTSPYLVFNSVEEYTNIATSGGGYTTLQTPTAAEQAAFTKYDATPFIGSDSQDDGSYPFVDFGNKYEISGASYIPQVLDGKSWATIATALSDPTSAIAQSVDGTANYITAAICEMTGNQPATACTSVVKSLQPKL